MLLALLEIAGKPTVPGPRWRRPGGLAQLFAFTQLS